VTTLPSTFDDAVSDLRARCAGAVLAPADDGYDTARSAFNVRFDQRPALVVAAESVDDVVAGVRFAAALGLRVAVQATGHGPARTADEGTLLIVTSRMTDVVVDPARRVARISAGARWSDVLGPAQQHGLAPLLGSTTHVGAVGYTLGGGFGWLGRHHGLCSDSVRSFDLVTADGQEVHASPTLQPELFWALKGGGAGTLGVVVGMEIDLYPVSDVYAGSLFYPAELAPEVIRRWREWVADMPEEMTSSVVMFNFPPLEMVPEPLRGRSFVIVRGCWSGDDLGRGQELVDRWRAWREPAMDMFGPMPFAAADSISMDPTDPMPAMVSTEWLETLDDEALDIVLRATYPEPGAPPTLLFAEIRHAGGAVRRKAADAANDLGRTGEFLLELVGVPPFPDAGYWLEAHLRLTRDALAPFVTGAAYLNFTEGEEKVRRGASAFSPENLRRMQKLKAWVDPDDRFAHGFHLETD
jgi:hypothetical protein